MRHAVQPAIAMSALLLAAIAGTGLPVSDATGAAPVEVAATGLPFEQAVADAVRAAFDAGRVRVEVESVDVTSANASQRELVARGRVALDDSGWIPFDLAALYDVPGAAATVQALALGGDARAVETGDAIADSLSGEATRRLQGEFAGQPVRIELAGVQARLVGNGLLALEAIGRADFDGEGAAAASVHALYDPRAGQWLRLQYRLGGDDTGEPVAGL